MESSTYTINNLQPAQAVGVSIRAQNNGGEGDVSTKLYATGNLSLTSQITLNIGAKGTARKKLTYTFLKYYFCFFSAYFLEQYQFESHLRLRRLFFEATATKHNR